MTAIPSFLALATSFGAGAVSFLSPCVLPLVPGYVSYVAGRSLGAPDPAGARRGGLVPLRLGLFFVLGFSTVFVALGASATALGRLLLAYRYEANLAGGALIVLFGLLMTGLFRLPWLERDLRFHPDLPGGQPAAAYLIGLAFAFGWTPCIGPILAGILALAATQETVARGMFLLLVYSLGLGVPFLLTGFGINAFLSFFARYKRYILWGERFAGALLVGVGVLIFSNRLTALTQLLPRSLFKFAL